MSKPPVGVVIVNWNLKDSLRATLLSFRRVNYPGLKVVVSDNASTDGSVEMVREEFPEVRLLTREKGLGYAKGANLGMEALAHETKYIFSTTNDVEVDPEMISRLVDYAEENPRVGVVGTKIFFHGRRDVLWHAGGCVNPWHGHSRHLGWERKDHPRYDRIRDCDYVTGCGFLLRSEVLRQIGCLNADLIFYFEDADLCYRIRKHGYRVTYLPTARMWHKVETTLAKNRALQLRYSTRNNLFLLQTHRVGHYPLTLLIHLLLVCPVKMAIFAIMGRWANARGIYRGVLDWRKRRYGWITE